MLNIKKLIASAESCLGWPYVSPGTNDSRGIDCSGLFVKCFRDQGASIYHGSNTIYRKYCSEKGQITSEKDLIPGMAVFKWNANTPEKFNDGQGDFQHIGLVVATNPLRIIHASSATMCVTTDTKIGKWKFWGKLKDVEYTSSDPTRADETVDPVVEQPVYGYVVADKVNFRYGPSPDKRRIEYLNTGDVVEIIGETGKWLKCRALGKTGYIMKTFVETTPPTPESTLPDPEDTLRDPLPVSDDQDWTDEENFVVRITGSGRVNIRKGNGTNYSRITSVAPDTTLTYVATAVNGWHAVRINNTVGWVSPEFSRVDGEEGAVG